MNWKFWENIPGGQGIYIPADREIPVMDHNQLSGLYSAAALPTELRAQAATVGSQIAGAGRLTLKAMRPAAMIAVAVAAVVFRDEIKALQTFRTCSKPTFGRTLKKHQIKLYIPSQQANPEPKTLDFKGSF